MSAADDLPAIRPHGDDVVTVGHVDGALEPLLHRQGVGRLGEVTVVDDHRVELVAHGEAVPRAEILVAGGRAQVVALRHGEEVGMPLVGDAAGLGRADGHGDDLIHGQLRAAGDVAAQRDPQPLVDHLPHGADAGADVHVGVGTVDHHHAVLLDGPALPLVGVDAVGHDGVVLPQAVFVVGLPILAALRVQLPHPGDLMGVLRQVGLDVQPALGGQLAQRRHQLIGAAGREPGREDGLDVLEPAAVQPAQRLGYGLLGGLLQSAGQAVAIHVHLTHVAGDAGTLQLVHEDQRGIGVEGGEHTHPGRAAGDQVGGQAAVDAAGVVRVGEAGLGGERVGVQPVQQRQVHAHAQHGVLGRVEVHIREGLHDEVVAKVLQLRVLQPLRHTV